MQRAPRSEIAFVLVVGILYVALTYWMPTIVSQFGLSAVATDATWAREGSRRLLIGCLGQGMLLTAVLGYSRVAPEDGLVRSIQVCDWRRFLGAAFIATVISISLAAAHLWPWTWQWPPYSALRILGALRHGAQVLGVLSWFVSTVVIIPVLEEIIFRFSILQGVWSITGSPVMGILASASLFALAHLGGSFHPRLCSCSWRLEPFDCTEE